MCICGKNAKHFQVKGLLPDEEKEKIGPKNVAASKGAKTSAIISAKPQANPNPVVSIVADIY